LALSKTSLTFIPNTALQSLRKLHTLDISRNSIIDWDLDCFRNMSSTFTKLYLDRNLITIINENLFPSEFLQDLGKTPFMRK
jgi:Leucine-rich repeat (LRR) protein